MAFIQVGILFLGVVQCIEHEYNTLETFDDSHFYPNVGLYLEPAGHYLSHSGTITIPFVYILPSVKNLATTRCPTYMSLEKVHDSVIRHLTDIIGTPTLKHNRSPRSLLPIVSVLTGGLSVWNTIEIQTVKSRISAIQEHTQYMDKALEKITNSQNIVIDRLGEVTTIIGEHMTTLRRLVNETECLIQTEAEFQMYMANWLYSAPQEFIAAYSGAVSGRVTPDLLSAKNLKHVLLHHKEMLNTLYQQQPEIIYELGRTLLVDVSIGDSACIKGVLQIPKMLSISPLPMYHTYSVNIIRNKIDALIKLPGVLICPQVPNCWSVDTSKCTVTINRIICMYGTDIVPQPCIKSIHSNSTDGCDIHVREHSAPLVIQTQSGVLLGATQKNLQMFTRAGLVDIPSTSIHKSETARLLTSKDGDWIMVTDNIYSTRISGFTYNSTTYITPAINLTNYVPATLPKEWTEIDKVYYNPPVINSPYLSGWLIVICLTLDILLLVCIAYLYHRIRRRQEMFRSVPLQELIGVR